MPRVDLAHQARILPDLVAGDLALAWDPGAGKTRPCLRAAERLGGPMLVIAPAHLRHTWAEAVGLDTPGRSVRIADSTKTAFSAETDISVVSYEFAKTLPRWKELRAQWWSAITCDEAHYLAHGQTARCRAILGSTPGDKYGLAFRTKHFWPISGTFIGGYPNELYPLLRFIFPGSVRSNRIGVRYMDVGEFENEFCITARNDFGTKIVGGKNFAELRERIAPYFDRVKLTDVVDMPPLVIDTIPVTGSLRGLTKSLTLEQLAEYRAIQGALEADIPDEEKLAALYDAEVMLAELRHAIAMVKIGEAEKIIRDEILSGVDRVLVFGWHREPLRELARRFNSAGLITGGMGHSHRTNVLDAFIRQGGVLFGQIGAMGSGLNIQAAHRTIFLEASWSTRDNTQAIHRTYRNGQRLPCHVSFLSLVGSVDEYVTRILTRKAKSVRQALD
jgi:hypothetical protein